MRPFSFSAFQWAGQVLAAVSCLILDSRLVDCAAHDFIVHTHAERLLGTPLFIYVWCTCMYLLAQVQVGRIAERLCSVFTPFVRTEEARCRQVSHPSLLW